MLIFSETSSLSFLLFFKLEKTEDSGALFSEGLVVEELPSSIFDFFFSVVVPFLGISETEVNFFIDGEVCVEAFPVGPLSEKVKTSKTS